jgi:hypothetical protein
MFSGCEKLTSFNCDDLSSLTTGSYMFMDCYNLITFNPDLTSLTNGEWMFHYCTNLESFSSDLSNLTNGNSMFGYCENLTTFTSDLSSLTNGEGMFNRCSNLYSFSSKLSSLTNAIRIFENCKLDSASVKNIISTINSHNGELTLGMGCNNTSDDRSLFVQEVGYADVNSLLAALQNKGWVVYAQFNGRPTTSYSLRQPAIEGELLPIFVKLEEVEETEKHADYTSMDGSKKYRLNWFHETTGSTEGYSQFNSLEEAIEHFNIKPIERN